MIHTPDFAAAIADGLLRISREERLREALGILADQTQHPDDVVSDACRVILTLTEDDEQFREAFEALRLREQLEKMP